MFFSNKIKDNTLYLYLNEDTEFALDLSSLRKKTKESFNVIYDYINEKGIKKGFNKIVIVASGIIVATLLVNPITNEPLSVNTTNDFKYVYNVNIDDKITPVFTNDIDDIVNDIIESNTIVEVNTNDIEVNSKQNIVVSSKTTVKEETKPVIKEEVKTEANPVVIIETKQESNDTIIKLYRSSGEVLNISLEDYVVGVVASEMPASFNTEALKAASCVARTYALKKVEANIKLTDTTMQQVYKDESQLKAIWGSDYNKYITKVKDAVNQTKGITIKYNNKYIDAVYHSTSNGATLNSEEVWGEKIPYLRSVSSPYDLNASSYKRESMFDYSILSSVFGITFDENTQIEVLTYASNGSVATVKIDGNIYKGTEVRTILALRSTDFEFSKTGSGVNIVTKGYGHGVGMSQYGANLMANAGASYKTILTHYYTGVTVN